jgi:hypothetical protein
MTKRGMTPRKSRIGAILPHHGGKGATGHGTTVFRPTLDLAAKWHKKFDEMMDDTEAKKAKAKVTLPTIKLREPKWEDES